MYCEKESCKALDEESDALAIFSESEYESEEEDEVPVVGEQCNWMSLILLGG